MRHTKPRRTASCSLAKSVRTCVIVACGFLGFGASLAFVGPLALHPRRPARQHDGAVAGWSAPHGTQPPLVTRHFYSGRGGPPAGGGEPPWLGTAFFAAIVLSFIPGPWQIILGPIISVINLFYMFKFGLFFLGIAAIFGLQWWFNATTIEAQCPRCGIPQRASKTEPFQCLSCGVQLEAKDEVFVPYVKSGKAPGTAFDQLRDFAAEAAAQAASKTSSKQQASTSSVGQTSQRPSSPKGPGKAVEVIDAEVL